MQAASPPPPPPPLPLHRVSMHPAMHRCIAVPLFLRGKLEQSTTNLIFRSSRLLSNPRFFHGIRSWKVLVSAFTQYYPRCARRKYFFLCISSPTRSFAFLCACSSSLLPPCCFPAPRKVGPPSAPLYLLSHTLLSSISSLYSSFSLLLFFYFSS